MMAIMTLILILYMTQPTTTNVPLPVYRHETLKLGNDAYLHRVWVSDSNKTKTKWSHPRILLDDEIPHHRRTVTDVDLIKGVIVDKAGIHFLHDGIYYIYISVAYNPNPNKHCDSYPSSWWLVNVLVKTATTGIERYLFRVDYSCRDNRSFLDSKHNGGLFKIHSGDVLYLEASVAGVTYPDPESSFIGLYMVRSTN